MRLEKKCNTVGGPKDSDHKVLSAFRDRHWVSTDLQGKENSWLAFCIFAFLELVSFIYRPLSQHPTVSDDLPNHIISGKVQVKSNVKEFTETDAIFDDETVEENIDVVIFATGYSFSFPFLNGLIEVTNNEVSLYKLVFPPTLEKPTLAVIGLIQPLGIILPIAELQSRWAVQVFKGVWSQAAKKAKQFTHSWFLFIMMLVSSFYQNVLLSFQRILSTLGFVF